MLKYSLMVGSTHKPFFREVFTEFSGVVEEFLKPGQIRGVVKAIEGWVIGINESGNRIVNVTCPWIIINEISMLLL